MPSVVNTQPPTYYGTSTGPAKPTDRVENGSCFIEMDTGKIYFYNAAGEQWIEWGASS